LKSADRTVIYVQITVILEYLRITDDYRQQGWPIIYTDEM